MFHIIKKHFLICIERFNIRPFKTGLLITVCSMFVVFACKSTSVQEMEKIKEPATVQPDALYFAETRPSVQDRKELTVAFSKSKIELDFRKAYLASEAQLFTAIYEGLFSYHPLTLEPVLAAAEKWNLSEDKKQWTFTIRQNARFNNGDPLRAEDFRASWLSLLEPKRDYPYSSLLDVIEGAYEYRTGTEKNPEKVGIHAPDAKTLIIKLNSPAAFFPSMLCHHTFSPIHSSMINKNSRLSGEAAADWKPPVSNGPFLIDTMDSNSIILLKNNQYWDARRVSLNKINIKCTESADEASYLWNSGEARWISSNVNIEALTDRSGIQFNIMFATHYYYVRCADAPWNDYRIRRAMTLVLPWEEIREAYALPAKTLIFPISGYPKVEGIYETNYEEAKQLLIQAGYADGKGIPELVIRLTPSREDARVGGIMANAWKENLGINVRVEVIPYERYFQSMKESGYIIGSSTWIGDFADPYTFLQMWRRDSNLNDARHYDADYEALIEKSMIEEGEVRFATLAEAEKLLLNRGVVLPISYSPALNIVDTGELDGWYTNALDIHPFKYLTFKAYRPLPGVAMGNLHNTPNSK
jgi:peptide/nickel transport system substrate-binding protein/oligopeptide transport system substrate-binding protein